MIAARWVFGRYIAGDIPVGGWLPAGGPSAIVQTQDAQTGADKTLLVTTTTIDPLAGQMEAAAGLLGQEIAGQPASSFQQQ